MRRSNVVRIEGTKLKEKLESRGFLTDLSEQMGYSRSYLGMVCKNNKITPYGATLIDKMFGIKFDEYKYVEPEPKPEPEPEPEEPVKETAFTNRSEQCLITLVNMVGEMRNNMIVLNEKLDKLIRLWGEA